MEPPVSSSRRHTAIGLLVCLTVVLLWFSPWWIGGKNLAPVDVLNEMMQPWRGEGEPVTAKNHIVSDAVDQYLVYRMVAAESYRQEGWLGWSSLTYGGTAQYANTMALYYDWTMQLHRWFDFWTAWHLGLMGQVMLAAAGMFLFLRGRSISTVWACCGALAHAANSQFVVWIYHRWALGAFCWVPWILWSIDCYRSGKRNFWALVPFFMALAFLGGTLQHAIYVILAVLAMWGEEAIRTGRSLAGQRNLFLRHAYWGLLGVGLAGMMFLPCADAFLKSTKLGLHMGMHGTLAGGIYPKGALQPLLNFAAYPLQVFPSVLGRCNTVDLLKLFKSELFYVAYFGSLPVLIAFLAFFRKQTPPLARLLIGTGLLLPLTPVLRHLYQRLYLLFILGGILAFVHFMETATAETKRRVFKITAAVTGLAIVAWTLVSGVLVWKAEQVHTLLQQKIVAPSAGSSFGHFRGWMQLRADRFQEDLLIWSPQQALPLALLIIGLTGLWLLTRASLREKQLGSWLVAVAVVLEVSVFGARWVTFADPVRSPLFPVTPEVTALREHVGNGRVLTMIEETGSHMAVTPFIPNTLSPYGIATIGGYDSIMPDGLFLINNPARDAETHARLGVTHLVTFPGNSAVGADWKSVWKSPSMELFENPSPVPRYAGFSNKADLDSFFKNHTRTGIIPLQETGGLENTRRLVIPPGTHWIRIAENHAEGWEYLTGSEWKPVTRAEDAGMLIETDGTTSEVRLRYHPPMRTAGFAVSSLSLAVLLSAAVVMARKRSLPA
jgi:hypothetical protein